MKDQTKIYTLTLSAVLCAIGIIIPMFSPVKIVLEPASFTLASHVVIFIALFISPKVAVAVSLGTTVGFFFGGFPLVVVIRALSHIVFVLSGSYMIKHHPDMLRNRKGSFLFSLIIAVIHAAAEVAVVIPFYFGNNLSTGYYEKGFMISVVLLVGVGTIVHSMIDFEISRLVWKPVKKVVKSPSYA